MARTMERTGLSEGMEREILAAVERAAEESDLPFLRHKSAWAPHGLAIILMGNLSARCNLTTLLAPCHD